MSDIYACTALIGGGAGALDSIDGDLLSDLDAAMVTTADKTYHYSLDADNGGSDDGLNIIAPDTNPGTKRWVLVNVQGGGLTYEVVTTGQTAQTGRGYLLNPSANITITLPASPSEGDTVAVVDAYNKAETYIITVARNGSKIEGVAEDLIVDVPGSGFTLVYTDSTRGWEIVSEIGAGSEPTIQFDYSNFVERGDPSAYDFSVGDFTTDDTYRDLDLSSIVPSDAIAVQLKVAMKDDAAGSIVYFRKNGNSSGYTAPAIVSQVANVINYATFIVPCDSSQVIEYRATNTTFTTLSVVVTGWFTDDSATVSINDNAVGQFKNKIINGDFNIWQRGTSFTSLSSSNYSADRWKWVGSTDAVIDVTQETDVPTFAESEHHSNFSLQVDVTTADTSIGAGQYGLLAYTIEGYDFLPMRDKYVTLSFWVKSTKTGTYCIKLGNQGADRSYLLEYTVNASDTWEKKILTFRNNYSGGTWLYNNGYGLGIYFILCCGSTFHASAGTWLSGNYLATSSQVNFFDSTSNNFLLSQVQLEIGSVASSFESRSFQQDLALCQRYYEEQVDTTTGIHQYVSSGGTTSFEVFFNTTKRAIPTITATHSAASNFNTSDPTVTTNEVNKFRAYKTATGTGAGYFTFTWTADAEL